jgi:uncharacterized protein (UPF0264 family)
MTGILLSVRNAEEASLANSYPIDLLDLKDPKQGSLGEVSAEVRQNLILAAPLAQPKSIALGELADWDRERLSSHNWSWLNDFQFAKVGLAQATPWQDWRNTWLEVREHFPFTTVLVGVAYADWERCDAPMIEEVFDWILESSVRLVPPPATNQLGNDQLVSGCGPSSQRALLIDTHFKDRGSTVDILGWTKIEKLIALAKRNQTTLVVAGSLRFEHLERLSELAPDYIGLRGAVCESHRLDLSPVKLAELYEYWSKVSPQPKRGWIESAPNDKHLT